MLQFPLYFVFWQHYLPFWAQFRVKFRYKEYLKRTVLRRREKKSSLCSIRVNEKQLNFDRPSCWYCDASFGNYNKKYRRQQDSDHLLFTLIQFEDACLRVVSSLQSCLEFQSDWKDGIGRVRSGLWTFYTMRESQFHMSVLCEGGIVGWKYGFFRFMALVSHGRFVLSNIVHVAFSGGSLCVGKWKIFFLFNDCVVSNASVINKQWFGRNVEESALVWFEIIRWHFHILFFLWRCDPTRVMASSFLRLLDHTQRRITVGRTPLDEWSARRRDLYLTAHNTYNKHPCPRWDSNSRSQQASGHRPTP